MGHRPGMIEDLPVEPETEQVDRVLGSVGGRGFGQVLATGQAEMIRPQQSQTLEFDAHMPPGHAES